MAVTLRNDLRPGDIGRIVMLHGVIYAREQGWDATFEAYVAGPLAEFALRRGDRDRLWIAEDGDRVVGCIAIVEAAPARAQLRWFLVDPAARGRGLGRRLLGLAVAFCEESGYGTVFLWTVGALAAAARLYRAAGFRLAETKPARLWGAEVVEERYERALRA